NRWQGAAASTQALHVSILRSFFGFLHEEGVIPSNPAERLKRPRRPRPEDLDVISLSRADVMRLFEGCETWQEFICVSVLAYLGPRRHAAARVRLPDVDIEQETIKFREKGSKVTVKPM